MLRRILPLLLFFSAFESVNHIDTINFQLSKLYLHRRIVQRRKEEMNAYSRIMENFIRKRGLDALFWFQNALNEGKTSKEIAKHFNVSEPRVIQWKKEFFRNRFVFTEDSMDYLETVESFQQHQLKVRMQSLKKAMADDGNHLALLYPIPVKRTTKAEG